jgi:hypothetical protein
VTTRAGRRGFITSLARGAALVTGFVGATARVAAGVTPEDAAAGKAAFAKMLTYPADRAAAKILDGVHRRRPRVLVAPSAVVVDVVARLLPTHYAQVLRLLPPDRSR